MMASEVMDLPEPDSPTSPSTSPGAMEKERVCTATAVPACDRVPDCVRGCGNSMVRSRTSSNGRTISMVSAVRLLLGPRFRRHQAGDSVIDHELSVVFAGMLDQSPSHVGNSHLLICEGINQ